MPALWAPGRGGQRRTACPGPPLHTLAPTLPFCPLCPRLYRPRGGNSENAPFTHPQGDAKEADPVWSGVPEEAVSGCPVCVWEAVLRVPALRQAQLREVRGEDPEEGTAGWTGHGWQQAKRAKWSGPDRCSCRPPAEPRAPAPAAQDPADTHCRLGAEAGGEVGWRRAGGGVWGLHSPSTCFRERYLKASSSRMTGSDIWSTATHWRPFSGVTWKMSWDGGVSVKGRSAQSPPDPPLHIPPATVDSSRARLRCPRPASRSVSTWSPPLPGPHPQDQVLSRWEVGGILHRESASSFLLPQPWGTSFFFSIFSFPSTCSVPQVWGGDVLKWGTHLAGQDPGPCGH